MAFVEWKDKFSVGISKCDNQHKGLIEILNNLHSYMKQGKGKKVIGDTISELILYTQEHFKTEEELFEKYEYPDKRTHITEHSKFVIKVSDFKTDFESGQILISVNLLQFLKTWLFNHISVSDKKYEPFFNSINVNFK